jgi:gas vesicle protein
MKNVWKGLTVGAFAGAAVGIVLDAFEGTRRRAADVSARTKAGARHLVDVIEEKIDEA